MGHVAGEPWGSSDDGGWECLGAAGLEGTRSSVLRENMGAPESGQNVPGNLAQK